MCEGDTRKKDCVRVVGADIVMETELIISVVSCVVMVFALVYARSEHYKAVNFSENQLQAFGIAYVESELTTKVAETEVENDRLRGLIASLRHENQQQSTQIGELKIALSTTSASAEDTESKLTASLELTEKSRLALLEKLESISNSNHQLSAQLRETKDNAFKWLQLSQENARTIDSLTQKNQQLQDDQLSSECVTCLTNKRTRLLEPCNHFCLCETCAPRSATCPVCRAYITRKTRVYT